MNNKLYRLGLLAISLLITSFSIVAQGIKGTVKDAVSGAALPGATIVVEGRNIGTVADGSGNYSLKLPVGVHQVKASSVGYTTEPLTITVSAGSFGTHDFMMKESSSTLQEVSVIGSRAATARTNVETPVPVDVISSKELKAFAQTDVTQILNYIAPSFSSNRQTVADGTDHIDPASLRGLGPDQVLVLVNGKRRHNSALLNINGSFGRGTVGTDMNAIPASAIERVEVLRDGAAAQYGSDAIAGVINIVLKKTTPLVINSMYGANVTSTLGRDIVDGKTTQLDFSKGWELNKKGYFNISGQFLDRTASNRGGLDTRPLLYSALPSKGAAETEAAFQTRYAALKAADDAKAQANGLDRNNMMVGNSAARNYGAFANFGYNISKNVEIYAAAGIANRKGKSAGFYRLPSQATQSNLTIFPNGFLPYINTTIDDYSFMAGLKTKYLNWNVELSNAWGMNSLRYDISNTINASIPTQANLDNGLEFYAGTQRFSQNTTNLDIAQRFELSGALTSLNVAAGMEYRNDNFVLEAGEEKSWSRGFPDGQNVTSATAAAGSQVFPGLKPSNALNKSRNNISEYVDLEGEFGPKLLVGVAARHENYSDFGSNFSYKATARYKLSDNFSVRGAYATGFRAPSLQQRYYNSESTQFVNGLPTQVLTVNNDNPIVSKFGVNGLKAELSKSLSLGITGKVDDFTFTLDAYQIKVTDRIVFSSQYTRERLSNGDLNPAGAVNTILAGVDPSINSVQFFANAVNTTTQGVDLVLAKKFNVGVNKLNVSVAGNYNHTEIDQINEPTAIESTYPTLKGKLFDRQQVMYFTTAVPKTKLNLSATYTTNKWTLTGRTVRFGEVAFANSTAPNGTTIPYELDQTFSAKWVSDITVNYNLTKNIGITIGANNVFDVYPDQAYIDPRNNANNLSGVADANGVPGTNYTTNRDNTSNGRFLYSRAVTQFGFNGRFLFGRLTFKI